MNTKADEWPKRDLNWCATLVAADCLCCSAVWSMSRGPMRALRD